MGSGTRSSGVAVVRVKPTSEYPCQWDDLVGAGGGTLATIYTFNEVRKEGLKPGITRGSDGVYDIVMSLEEIDHVVVRKALKELGKITSVRYILSV
jgi:hypothetical protein